MSAPLQKRRMVPSGARVMTLMRARSLVKSIRFSSSCRTCHTRSLSIPGMHVL